MYTSILLVALAGPQAPPETMAPDWKQDYAVASREGKTARKPLAAFFGHGADGWGQVSDTGQLGPRVRDLLRSEYVCLYVDRDTPAGQKLAAAFELAPEGPGLVISDRTGEVQAFRRSGKMAPDLLTGYLRAYSDPNRVVSTTENGERSDVRFYPTNNGASNAQGGTGGQRYFYSSGCSS